MLDFVVCFSLLQDHLYEQKLCITESVSVQEPEPLLILGFNYPLDNIQLQLKTVLNYSKPIELNKLAWT